MLTLYQVLLVWGKTLHFKWRERLGIEPRNPITITAFTGQRDHIVTKPIFNKRFHIVNLSNPHFFTKRCALTNFKAKRAVGEKIYFK